MIRINFKLHMKNESNGQDLRMNFEIVNVYVKEEFYEKGKIC